MSSFQRFVSYINSYEENKKIRNVGFARTETRGNQCTMEIHLKGTGYTGISCPVYLFVRQERELLGISLGKITMQNGAGDLRLKLNSEDIEQSSYGLDKISGIMIFVNEEIMFVSQWDEKEISREQFVVLKAKEVGEPERVEEIKEVKKQAETPKQEEIKEEEKVLEAAETEESPTIKATEAALQTKVIPMEQSWHQKWQFIKENYPVLTPFEEKEDIICVRLELKDIRLLPKRYWYLGNNSFLLHGFFSYRYLVLGHMKEDGEDRWFIGVPGIFQSQEKVMASVFGFPEYKSEKKAQQKTGQFGYWYRFMDE